MSLYLFDLIGTFAFALVGAQFALAHRLNAMGVIIFASLTAVGGGTLRELLLHHTPFYFYDYLYLAAILIAVFCAFAAQKWSFPVKNGVLILDALGTVIFAFGGASVAMAADLGLPGMVLFAALTAFGGGALCDVALGQTPRIFRHGLPVLPALLLGCTCWLLGGDRMNNVPLVSTLLLCAYSAQLCIVYQTTLVNAWKKYLGRWLKQSGESVVL